MFLYNIDKVTSTFPLLTLSVQALMYIGIAMITSSHACTVPARQRDMGAVRASSTCCSRSSCSSHSDRLTLRRAGLDKLSESRLVDDGRGAGLKCELVYYNLWANSSCFITINTKYINSEIRSYINVLKHSYFSHLYHVWKIHLNISQYYIC